MTGDRLVPLALGREVAAMIDGARFIEYPGEDAYAWVDPPGLDDLEEFLTGRRTQREPDRVLATVMFTDIVGSTEHAARIGDGRWLSCWASTTRSSAASSNAGAEPRSRRSATASWRPSTARRARSGAPRGSSMQSGGRFSRRGLY